MKTAGSHRGFRGIGLDEVLLDEPLLLGLGHPRCRPRRWPRAAAVDKILIGPEWPLYVRLWIPCTVTSGPIDDKGVRGDGAASSVIDVAGW
jgi:hypothetical protein